MDALIFNFHQANEILDKISKIEEEINNKHSSKARTIKNYYGDRIRNLERTMNEKIYALDDEKKRKLEALGLGRPAQLEIINKVERYIHFIHLYLSNGVEAKAPEVTFRPRWNEETKTPSPVATLREDYYNKVYLYIIPNRKPTNKFSLVIRGQCSLMGSEDAWKARVEKGIKDAPSEKALQDYMTKNLEKIKVLIDHANLDRLAAEYEETVKLFETGTVWKIFYLERRVAYYYAHVSGGSTSQEFKDLQEILKQMRKKPKDLSLLVGSIESDEGKSIFEYLLKHSS